MQHAELRRLGDCLRSTLKAGGLKLDVQTANREVLRWLPEVANVRIHAATGERPSVRLSADREHLSPLAVMAVQANTAAVRAPQDDSYRLKDKRKAGTIKGENKKS